MSKKKRVDRAHTSGNEDRESGQASIYLLLVLGTFLLGTLAFAVDLGNLWFHRQAAQAAADAACQAGAMDMLAKVGGLSMPNMGFTVGSASDCTSSASSVMCTYAKYNGYSGTGFTSTTTGTAVSWTFPASVSGATAPPTSVTSYPYMKVVVSENVKTWFMSLLGKGYQQVGAACTCGLAEALSAAPLVVLHPTAYGALNLSGAGVVTITGGPARSLQINSNSSSAFICSGSGRIDTSTAGPNHTGGDVALVGGPTSNPTCGGGSAMTGGTTGSWRSPALPIPDPFASVPAVTKPGKPARATNPVSGNGYSQTGDPTYGFINGTWVATGVDTCPDSTNHYLATDNKTYAGINGNCLEFTPGYYPTGINLSTLASYNTAIFMPGIYYLNGNLESGSSVTVRNAWIGPQPSTQGVMFYFLSGGPSFDGASGGSNSNIASVPSYYLNCSGTTGSSLLPTTLNGNVLAAQCTASGTYYGSPSSDVPSSAGSRGLLFMADSSDVLNQTIFGASGTLTFSGSFYFHNTSYQDRANLNGAGGTTTEILGEIIADQINLSGSGAINMALNPNPSIDLLKVSIFQ